MSSDRDSHPRSGERFEAVNPAVNYEPQDVNPSSIFKFLLWLVLTVVFSLFIVWRIYGVLAARKPPPATSPSPLRSSAGRILPDEPRLQGAPGHQTNPQEELRQMRSAAEATLSSYGWVDEKAGIARIPVAEAMRLLSQRSAVPRGKKKEEKQP